MIYDIMIKSRNDNFIQNTQVQNPEFRIQKFSCH